MSKEQQYVKRFNFPVRLAHWINAFAFLALYLTALPMYTEFFDWLYPIFGGPENARLLHRIFAIMFIMPTLIVLIFDTKSFTYWIKSCFTWKKEDFKFFIPFAKDFFGKKSDIPKQDFYNVGEKVNSLLQIVATICIIGSGIIMWNADNFPAGLVHWAYPVHNIAVGLAIAVIIGHFYLSVINPSSKKSLRGMIKGSVEAEYAEDHHALWYESLQEESKNKNSDNNISM